MFNFFRVDFITVGRFNFDEVGASENSLHRLFSLRQAASPPSAHSRWQKFYHAKTGRIVSCTTRPALAVEDDIA
jgi:hypothetical protein